MALARGALVVAVASVLAPGRDAAAQLRGPYIPGSAGLQSGSQAPPGVGIALPLFLYPSDTIKDEAGQTVDSGGASVQTVFLAPTVTWVTKARILGGNLGGLVMPVAFIRSRLEGPSFRVPGSFEFTDIYVRPLQLGWQRPRADFVFGYGFFVPTGRWKLLADDNTGTGM
jgi:hypothetical protein